MVALYQFASTNCKWFKHYILRCHSPVLFECVSCSGLSEAIRLIWVWYESLDATYILLSPLMIPLKPLGGSKEIQTQITKNAAIGCAQKWIILDIRLWIRSVRLLVIIRGKVLTGYYELDWLPNGRSFEELLFFYSYKIRNSYCSVVLSKSVCFSSAKAVKGAFDESSCRHFIGRSQAVNHSALPLLRPLLLLVSKSMNSRLIASIKSFLQKKVLIKKLLVWKSKNVQKVIH